MAQDQHQNCMPDSLLISEECHELFEIRNVKGD